MPGINKICNKTRAMVFSAVHFQLTAGHGDQLSLLFEKTPKARVWAGQAHGLACISLALLLMCRMCDLVAQPVEHLTFNQGVMGSNPIEVTTLINCWHWPR